MLTYGGHTHTLGQRHACSDACCCSSLDIYSLTPKPPKHALIRSNKKLSTKWKNGIRMAWYYMDWQKSSVLNSWNIFRAKKCLSICLYWTASLSSKVHFFGRNLAIIGFGIKRKEGWRRKCSAAAAAATQAARRTVPYLTFTTPKPSQAEGVHWGLITCSKKRDSRRHCLNNSIQLRQSDSLPTF